MRTPFAAKSLRDMAISIGVIMIPIVLISWFFTRPAQTPVQAVDWRAPLASARAEAGYPVLSPERLGQGWTVTKARWAKAGQPGVGGQPVVGNTWALGALGPDQVYYSLEQTDAAADALVARVCREGEAAGESTVAGAAWQRCRSADGRTRVLWRTQGRATTVVAGDADFPAVEAWLAQLS